MRTGAPPPFRITRDGDWWRVSLVRKGRVRSSGRAAEASVVCIACGWRFVAGVAVES